MIKLFGIKSSLAIVKQNVADGFDYVKQVVYYQSDGGV